MVRVGCCGFPKGMKSYFSQFRLVEVQQTFYKPPLPQTVMKWREGAGEDFEFCLKAWQLITHPLQPHLSQGRHSHSPGEGGLLWWVQAYPGGDGGMG